MAKKRKVKQDTDRTYTYFQVVNTRSRMALALEKLTTIYIPDLGEMTKLTPLVRARKAVYAAYEDILDRVKKDVNEEYPLPGKKDMPGQKDTSAKAKKARADAEKKQAARNRELNERVTELLNQKCDFDPGKKIVLDQDALQQALEREAEKPDRKSRTVCPECGAVVQSFDPDRNLLTAADIAELNDFVEIKELKKGKKI